jgi:hypothetical protein
MLVPSLPSSFAADGSTVAVVGGGAGAWSLYWDWFAKSATLYGNEQEKKEIQ